MLSRILIDKVLTSLALTGFIGSFVTRKWILHSRPILHLFISGDFPSDQKVYITSPISIITTAVRDIWEITGMRNGPFYIKIQLGWRRYVGAIHHKVEGVRGGMSVEHYGLLGCFPLLLLLGDGNPATLEPSQHWDHRPAPVSGIGQGSGQPSSIQPL